MPRQIFTIGHSTHPIDRFLGLLHSHEIAVVADVRRYPGSRRNPQFNAGALARALDQSGIAYEAIGEELGGRRSPVAGDSANAAWKVDAFRGYADYMQEAGFAEGRRRLEDSASGAVLAVMCAEADWRRCHRRLIADALASAGWRVLHIGADGTVEPHAMTTFAVVRGGRIAYPPAQGALTDLSAGG